LNDARRTEGLRRLAKGERELKNAMFENQFDSAVAEGHARGALITLRSAMDWLEDTTDFDAAHKALDDAGRKICTSFGCHLGQEGTEYWQECPVVLAHNRIGMSVGVVVEAVECSICRRDPEECKHVTGREYEGERCTQVITKFSLTEVALVRRPAFPDARLGRIGISIDELRTELGPLWRPGMRVRCTRCLEPCEGITEHDTLGSH
jgi:hypothetical protein